jgi:hypothetical protein
VANDRVVNCVCVSSNPNQWTDGENGPDVTDLVNELNALNTFEPKISGMEFVQITIDEGEGEGLSSLRRTPRPKGSAGKASARKRSPKKASAKKASAKKRSPR